MEAKEILLNKQNFAVIGVTTNQEKYGYKIYQQLKKLNKNVYGVSPIYNELNGETIYPNLSSINTQIDVAVFVVNPKIALTYIEECKELKIKHIWLQPGTYDDNLIKIINESKLNYYLNCILVESKNI